jgi:hypothetical protein
MSKVELESLPPKNKNEVVKLNPGNHIYCFECVISPLERSEKDSALQSRNSAEKDLVLPKRNSGAEAKLGCRSETREAKLGKC